MKKSILAIIILLTLTGCKTVAELYETLTGDTPKPNCIQLDSGVYVIYAPDGEKLDCSLPLEK